MENIGKFLAQCPPYGVRSDELFQAPDLYEGTNMTAVSGLSILWVYFSVFLCFTYPPTHALSGR